MNESITFNHDELTKKQLIDRYKHLLKKNLHLDIRPKSYINEIIAIENEFKYRGVKRSEWH